jgi:dienelactone hydrolase
MHTLRLALPASSGLLRRLTIIVMAVGVGVIVSPPLRAAPPRALPAGQIPRDARLGPLKDLNGYFPFAPPASAEAWARRAAQLRVQLLVSQGLWPLPEKTPLRAVVHGRIDRGDYTVEKVFFESVPGFFLTGNLYRPKAAGGRRPGVLSPHGHWPGGRFFDNPQVNDEVARGAERFREGGRSMQQARCVQLARLGCVVFAYDMIGYGDNLQVPFAVAHQEDALLARPEMNTRENWGLFTPQAEAHLQSVMGLQTWNSIRALDFLASLPDVDAARLAVTGESGGGTQTFLLCALDARPAAAFPAVMVSTGMQGGCTCENASLLRLGTGNVEIAALFAPKPLGLTAADDWTRQMPTKGYPELRQLYTTLGAPEHVHLTPLLQFKHNYNYPSRAAMYAWFNRHLHLGQPEPIVEQDYRVLTKEEMTVWDAAHPPPAGGPEFERKLLRELNDRSNTRLATARRSVAQYRELVAPALTVIIGRTLADAGDVAFEANTRTDRGAHWETAGLLRNLTHSEALPLIRLEPKAPARRTVVWIDPRGKSALYADGPAGAAPVRPEIAALLAAGSVVIGVDLFQQGEFRADGRELERAPLVKNSPIAGYTFGYNRALFAQRVHDILSAVKFARGDAGATPVALAGFEGAGPWVAAARALCDDAVERAAIATDGFRFGHVLAIDDPNFLPGGAKYDDLPGMLALAAPQKLWLAGEGRDGGAVVRALYTQAGAANRLTAFDGAAAAARTAAVQWLLAEN